MHVAHFVQRYPPAVGGSEAYFARLGGHLTGCGDEVTVWTSTAVELGEMWGGKPDPSPGPSPRGGGEKDGPGLTPPPPRGEGDGDRGLTLHRFPPTPLPVRRYLLKAASLVPVRPWQCLTSPCNPVCAGMWRAAGRYAGPLDAVHATAFPYSFPIACGLRLARRRGVPFLLTPFLHTGDPDDPRDRTRRQYTRPHLRWLLRQADRVFVQTQIEQNAVIGLGVAGGRVIVQGLGVDPAECTGGDRAAARRGWGIGPDEVVIGHLANASVEKGTVDLLRAAERAWSGGARFRVVLAGPEMPNFAAVWTSYGSKDRVTRLGVLTDRQKRDFFAGIDAFALPSRSDSFGLVLLEAWANGKPNLVYRAGGPAELVRDGVDGLQARCGDASELGEQLRRLVAGTGLRHRLGEAGRARVGREFRWADKLALVREVMAESVRRPGGRSNRRPRAGRTASAASPASAPGR